MSIQSNSRTEGNSPEENQANDGSRTATNVTPHVQLHGEEGIVNMEEWEVYGDQEIEGARK